ncbi:NADH dehydrogenase subunit [bacterium]|nr:MAG: NADH dehydrogenase subunit [bacterium]RKZ16256.1 MAG: NADH dehydrogenase subunit [bacterium]
MATITIDSVEHEFEAGMNLFEAIREANGEPLPHFCYHPGLSIAGVCRMCQVEIEGAPKLVVACNATVRDGMVVHTRSERVNRAVQSILNFHLLHHPVDCPVCDQAGECSLQDFYMEHGLYESEIDIEDKIAKGKVKPIGELVMLDAERCVLCARCTRFTSEVTKTHELGIFNRGNHAEIDVAPGMTLDNNYSLNTVDLCPVGALTSRDFRFQKRVWWLSENDSVCTGCATGCNMTVHHDADVAYRFKPRHNDAVNGYWMCDEGRLGYKQLNAESRLGQPLIDGSESSWEAAFEIIRQAVAGSQVAFVGSPHATLEELFALRRVAEAASADLLGYRLAGTERGEADDLLVSADRTPNATGAARLGLREFDADALASIAGKVVFVLQNDLAGLDEAAAVALKSASCVVLLATDANATASLAKVVLPIRNAAEKTGTLVNGQGRAQALNVALGAPEHSRDAIAVLRRIAQLLGHEFAWEDAQALCSELAGTVEGFAALSGGCGELGVNLDAGAPTTVGGEVQS